MGNNNVIFTFDGREIAIQCSNDDKMRDVCQKFAVKAETNKLFNIFIRRKPSKYELKPRSSSEFNR